MYQEKTINIYPFPYSAKNNQYLDILYGKINDSQSDGFIFRVLKRKLPDLFREGLVNRKAKNIIHIHWENAFYGSRYFVRAVVRGLFSFSLIFFLKYLFKFKICWTMHNLKAHNFPFPALDKIGRKLTSLFSDRIIIQQKSYYQSIAAARYGRKFKFVPHLSFAGAYGPILANGNENRGLFGFNETDIIFLSLGIIKPYKKIEEIIRVFSRITDPKFKLLIIGSGEPAYIASLFEIKGDNKNIVIQPEFVKNEAISKYFSIADYSVFWYDDSVLTSGGIVLSLSYGVPVIARAIPAADNIKNGENGYVFADDEALLPILKKLSSQFKLSKDKTLKSAEEYNLDKVTRLTQNIYLDI